MTYTHNVPADDELTEIARILDERLGEMLPGIRASDERNIRSSHAAHQRRMGEPLDADEIRHDLRIILARFVTAIVLAKEKQIGFLAAPAQILMYAERAAAYAIKDYPREFEAHQDVMGLWDALENIKMAAEMWRIDKDRDKEQTVIGFIDRTAQNALQGIYPD